MTVVEIVPSVVIDCSKKKCKIYELSLPAGSGPDIINFLEQHKPSVIFHRFLKTWLLDLLRDYYKTYEEVAEEEGVREFKSFEDMLRKITTDPNWLYDFIETYEDLIEEEILVSFLVDISKVDNFYVNKERTLGDVIRETLLTTGKSFDDIKTILVQSTATNIHAIAVKFTDGTIEVILFGFLSR
jgi:hypothetical protein